MALTFARAADFLFFRRLVRGIRPVPALLSLLLLLASGLVLSALLGPFLRHLVMHVSRRLLALHKFVVVWI
jgi:hypothetical protein